jgi:hypothetical protein
MGFYFVTGVPGCQHYNFICHLKVDGDFAVASERSEAGIRLAFWHQGRYFTKPSLFFSVIVAWKGGGKQAFGGVLIWIVNETTAMCDDWIMRWMIYMPEMAKSYIARSERN